MANGRSLVVRYARGTLSRFPVIRARAGSLAIFTVLSAITKRQRGEQEEERAERRGYDRENRLMKRREISQAIATLAPRN